MLVNFVGNNTRKIFSSQILYLPKTTHLSHLVKKKNSSWMWACVLLLLSQTASSSAFITLWLSFLSPHFSSFAAFSLIPRTPRDMEKLWRYAFTHTHSRVSSFHEPRLTLGRFHPAWKLRKAEGTFMFFTALFSFFFVFSTCLWKENGAVEELFGFKLLKRSIFNCWLQKHQWKY